MSPTPSASTTTEVWQIPGIEELVRPSLRQNHDSSKSRLLVGISDDDDGTQQGSSTAGYSDSSSSSSDRSQGSDCATSDDGTDLGDYPPYGHHHPQAHAAVVPGDYAHHYRRRQQLSHQPQQPAALVVDPCHNHQLGTRSVHVPRTTPNHAKVFVGGLPNEVRNLKQYFEGHGEVVDHIVMIDRASKRSRGFGFVTFAREEDAKRLLTSVPGEVGHITIMNKQCELKKCEPEVEREEAIKIRREKQLLARHRAQHHPHGSRGGGRKSRQYAQVVQAAQQQQPAQYIALPAAGLYQIGAAVPQPQLGYVSPSGHHVQYQAQFVQVFAQPQQMPPQGHR